MDDRRAYYCSHCGGEVRAYDFGYLAMTYGWERIDGHEYCEDCIDKIARISLWRKYDFSKCPDKEEKERL